MVDNHALAEAHGHERRRLLAAFVCGRPAGREAELSRPARSLLAGLLLAALLAAGFAVPRLLDPAAATDLTSTGALVVDEHGSAYVVVDASGARREAGATTEVSEVANLTSAMLLLGPDVEAVPTTSHDLARRPRGPRIGIVEAPGAPPLVGGPDWQRWTACTSDGAGTTLVLDPPGDEVVRARGAVAVSAGQRHFVVVGEHAYEVPAGPELAPVLAAVAQRSPDDATEVPAEWVGLFPRGGTLELASFGLAAADLGTPARARPGLPSQARVGDLLRPADPPPAGPAAYLVRSDDVLDLTGFALAVYRALSRPLEAGALWERRVVAAPGGAQEFVRDDPDLAWPDRPLGAASSAEVCASLDTLGAPGVDPATHVGVTTSDVADPAAPGTTKILVEPGHGALVGGAGADVEGENGVGLVDDRGHLFELDDQARDRLGYGATAPTPVPAVWLALLVPGGPLTADRAALPVGTDAESQEAGGGSR